MAAVRGPDICLKTSGGGNSRDRIKKDNNSSKSTNITQLKGRVGWLAKQSSKCAKLGILWVLHTYFACVEIDFEHT